MIPANAERLKSFVFHAIQNGIHYTITYRAMSYTFLINEQEWRVRLEPLLTQPTTVYKEALCNTHYEGDIKSKAQLNIVTLGDLTYSSYTGADITYQTPTQSEVTLNINQTPIIPFLIDDPLQVTTEIKLLDIYSQRAAYQLLRSYDDYIASLYTEIVTNIFGNSSGAWSVGGYSGNGPVTIGFDITGGDVLPSTALAAMRQIAVQNNAFQTGKGMPNVVVPPWLDSMIRQELGLRVGTLGDQMKMSGTGTGKSEGLSGFCGWGDIYVSNLVPNTSGTAYKVMGGVPDSSVTFASAYEKTEALRSLTRVATIVRILAIFGATIPFEGHMTLGTFNIGSYLTNPRSY